MTRINLVPVRELTDQHLLAEHREIKRIPNTITSWRYNLENISNKFVLWVWHIKFFYDKILFLHKRYIELYKECLKRWFKIEDYSNSFYIWEPCLYNDYKPTEEAIQISKKRIKEKLTEKPLFYRYYWKPYNITKSKYGLN